MNVEAPSGLTLRSSQRAQTRHDTVVRCEERGRIARELHDSTSQLLVALQLNVACLKASSENADTHQLFCALDATLQELHSAVRAISSFGERSFPEKTLPAALRAMATHFDALFTIKVTLDVKGDYVSQADEVEMSLYRITQEALANVARHAHARAVKLQLDCRETGVLKLTIEDDGVGFPRGIESHVSDGGTGIGNIRQRVQDMGGDLTLRNLRRGSLVAVTIYSPLLPGATAA